MKIINILMAAVFGGALFINGGCANHLRYMDMVTQESDRKVLSTKYDLKLSPETVKDSSYHIEIHKLESAEIKKYEVRTVKSIATPYQWWREFYEVPAGIGLLPVSLGSHLLFLCSFGILPYDIPKSINELSFTGMNPMLNWEDESRSEDTLKSLDRKMLSHTSENLKTPLAKQNIVVRSGNQHRIYSTDDFGGFDLHFLALQEKESFFPSARKVSFTLDSAESRELKALILTRDYLSKLLWAKTRINAYKMNPSGKNLFDTVIFLEKNGFEQLGYLLEEKELARKANDKKFQADFKSASHQK